MTREYLCPRDSFIRTHSVRFYKHCATWKVFSNSNFLGTRAGCDRLRIGLTDLNQLNILAFRESIYIDRKVTASR